MSNDLVKRLRRCPYDFTQEAADLYTSKCLACIKVDLDFEEGEGL